VHQNCLMDGSLHEAISKIHSVENVLVLDSLVSTSETVICRYLKKKVEAGFFQLGISFI
jgi:hypothetical protein